MVQNLLTGSVSDHMHDYTVASASKFLDKNFLTFRKKLVKLSTVWRRISTIKSRACRTSALCRNWDGQKKKFYKKLTHI